MHFVSVCKSFSSIIIRACSHQQVTSIRVHHRVLRLQHDQFLKVKEGLRCVTDEVRALSSEQVRVEQLVVKLDHLVKV